MEADDVYSRTFECKNDLGTPTAALEQATREIQQYLSELGYHKTETKQPTPTTQETR